MILDVNERWMAVDDGNAVVVIEAEFQRAGLEIAVPVRSPFTESKVPLANAGCRVTSVFHQAGDCLLTSVDHQSGLEEDRLTKVLPMRILTR